MRLAIATLALTLVAALAAPASADSLLIDFHGLNLTLNDHKIYDTDHLAGGSGLVADATPLATSIVFTKYSGAGASVVESITNNIFADVYIDGVPDIPVSGDLIDFTPASSGFVDLFNGATRLLHLPVTSASVSYDDIFGFELSAFVSPGIVQNLPGGLVYDVNQTITVGLLGELSETYTIEDDLLTGFVGFDGATGRGESLGTLVPEPSSLVLLLGLAASALAARASRRRSR